MRIACQAFKENVALVTKYLDKLGAIMQQQP